MKKKAVVDVAVLVVTELIDWYFRRRRK